MLKAKGLRNGLLILLIGAFLAGCGGADKGAGAAGAVEAYLQALAARDLNQMISNACAAWEAQAKLEYDSFAAVKLELKDVSCQTTGEDQGYTLVACSGSIIANYGDEDVQIDVANQTFQVIQEGGDWRVCGYHSPQ